MEKIIWNGIGVLLFVANVLALVFCFAAGESAWGFALIVLAALDWLYKEKRPTWIEV